MKTLVIVLFQIVPLLAFAHNYVPGLVMPDPMGRPTYSCRVFNTSAIYPAYVAEVEYVSHCRSRRPHYPIVHRIPCTNNKCIIPPSSYMLFDGPMRCAHGAVQLECGVWLRY